MMACKKPALVP